MWTSVLRLLVGVMAVVGVSTLMVDIVVSALPGSISTPMPPTAKVSHHRFYAPVWVSLSSTPLSVASNSLVSNAAFH